jgi:hypothetical protein
MRVAAGAAALLLGAALAACGFRTDPRPPEDTSPVIARTPEVQLTDAGDVRVRWRRATESVDGKRLTDLAGFHVERSADGGEFATVATIDIIDRQKLRQREKFSWVDAAAPGGELRYRVRAFLADGQVGAPTAAASIRHDQP